MIQLGTVQIHNDNSIVQCRNKIRVLSLDLDFSPVVATRIATATSEICSILLQSNSHSSVKIAFDKIDERLGLLMVFDPATRQLEEKNFNLLFDHFEFVSDKQGKEQIKAFKFFSNLNFIPSQNFIEAAKGKLLELSREELEKELEKANERMRGELNIAKDIQMSMLPANEYVDDFIDLYAYLSPAREVGGDFYDFFEIDDDHLGFVVGDVSGKGVPAALMMAVCKTYIKSYSSANTSTAEIITKVNNEMAKENTNYMFVTVFMAILNTTNGKLTYTNAGHNPTYIRRKADNSLEKLTTLHGPVVAAMEGLTYKESYVQLRHGDHVFMYTDGIPEAHNDQDEMFTDASLANFLKNEIFVSSKQTVQSIIEVVEKFENGADRFDDITALCLDYSNKNIFMKDEASITIKNSIDQLQSVMDCFEEFAGKNALSMKITMQLNIAIDEFISNTIKYAFSENSMHEITVEFTIENNNLKLTIEDDGIEFDPFGRNPPDTTLGIQEREIGGLGIHITKELMDEYSYTRVNGINTILLIKNNVLST
jgi:sigma-B regulation protein RsbU (phosphoserine phosphatase)